MLMIIPVKCNKRNGNGGKGWLSSSASSNRTNANGITGEQRGEPNQNVERVDWVVHCGNYQHRNCNNTGNHSVILWRKRATATHLYCILET